LLGRAAAEALPCCEHLAQRPCEPRIRKEEVDEARTCDLGMLDLRQRRRALRQLRRQLARSLPPRAREPERGVRCVVAVRRIARSLELEVRADPVRDRVR